MSAFSIAVVYLNSLSVCCCCCAFLINRRSLLIEFFRSHTVCCTHFFFFFIRYRYQFMRAKHWRLCSRHEWGYVCLVWSSQTPDTEQQQKRKKTTYIRKWSKKIIEFFHRTFCAIFLSFDFRFFFFSFWFPCQTLTWFIWVACRSIVIRLTLLSLVKKKIFEKSLNDFFVTFDALRNLYCDWFDRVLCCVQRVCTPSALLALLSAFSDFSR